MPKATGMPLDLAGRRFGKLTAIMRGQPLSPTQRVTWLCRCDCGTEETIARIRLPYRDGPQPRNVVYSCTACRTGACAVCGSPVTDLRAATCSPACAGEYRRIYDAAWAREARRLEGPEQRKKRLDGMKAGYRRRKAEATPEQREQRRDYRREHSRRQRAGDELLALISEIKGKL